MESAQRKKSQPLVVEDGKKLCSKCDRHLDVSSFHKDRSLPSGLRNWCKSCAKEYHSKNKGKPYGTRSLPDSDIDKVVSLYLENKSYREISEIFNISMNTVGNILKSKGITPRAQKRSNHVVVPEGFSYCGRCRSIKESNLFHKRKSTEQGKNSVCIECDRDKRLISVYGMDLKKYNALLEGQNGTCAICKGENKNDRNLAVDHCHKSGKIRGLLCENCNRALGLFEDDPIRMIEAIRYIERHRNEVSF